MEELQQTKSSNDDKQLGEMARLGAGAARMAGVRVPGGTVRAASSLVTGAKSWVEKAASEVDTGHSRGR